MPTVFTELPSPTEVRRKRWTRSEFDVLLACGAVDGQHFELIDGELIDRMGNRPPHMIAVTLMRVWLSEVFGPRLLVTESSIDVSPQDNPTNEPQPDVMVLNRDVSHFSASPLPRDLLLVVEVSDSSLGFDLTTKAALYARASIVEYWVLDVRGRRLYVHRDPKEGRYTTVVAYSSEETVSPLKAPAARLRVADVLG